MTNGRFTQHGFTLIEVVAATALLALLLILVFGQMAALRRGVERANRGHVELLAAARAAECFRADVTQAREARVLANGELELQGVQSVEETGLLIAADPDFQAWPTGRTVGYRLGPSGCLERRVDQGSWVSGPRLRAASFGVECAAGRRLVRTTWACEAESPREGERPHHFEPRVLILDTLLRAEALKPVRSP